MLDFIAYIITLSLATYAVVALAVTFAIMVVAVTITICVTIGVTRMVVKCYENDRTSKRGQQKVPSFDGSRTV